MDNTAFMRGGALGLAVRASLAAARTAALAGAGAAPVAALAGGYRVTFLAGAVIAAVAAALAAALVRSRNRELGGHGDAPAGH